MQVVRGGGRGWMCLSSLACWSPATALRSFRSMYVLHHVLKIPGWQLRNEPAGVHSRKSFPVEGFNSSSMVSTAAFWAKYCSGGRHQARIGADTRTAQADESGQRLGFPWTVMT